MSPDEIAVQSVDAPSTTNFTPRRIYLDYHNFFDFCSRESLTERMDSQILNEFLTIFKSFALASLKLKLN